MRSSRKLYEKMYGDKRNCSEAGKQHEECNHENWTKGPYAETTES